MSALTDDITTAVPRSPSGSSDRRGMLRAWRSIFMLDPIEASFARRGLFASNDRTRQHLERIGETFIAGYNRALLEDVPAALAFVGTVDADYRGFAVEGAAMGATIADAIVPGDSRLRQWLASSENEFTYLAHVGAGWALARVPWRKRRITAALDPVHHWLMFDGTGFHDGYFKSAAICSGWRRIRNGYAARAYDQGVGRAMWFIAGGAVERAAEAIAGLPAARHGDLWSGLGLAMTYAGHASPEALAWAVRRAGSAWRDLAQGAAFGAEAHARARHIPAHTAEAIRIVTALDVETAVWLVRRTRNALASTDTPERPRYEAWRCDVRDALSL
jgi:hypothetical protein